MLSRAAWLSVLADGIIFQHVATGRSVGRTVRRTISRGSSTIVDRVLRVSFFLGAVDRRLGGHLKARRSRPMGSTFTSFHFLIRPDREDRARWFRSPLENSLSCSGCKYQNRSGPHRAEFDMILPYWGLVATGLIGPKDFRHPLADEARFSSGSGCQGMACWGAVVLEVDSFGSGALRGIDPSIRASPGRFSTAGRFTGVVVSSAS